MRCKLTFLHARPCSMVPCVREGRAKTQAAQRHLTLRSCHQCGVMQVRLLFSTTARSAITHLP